MCVFICIKLYDNAIIITIYRYIDIRYIASHTEGFCKLNEISHIVFV